MVLHGDKACPAMTLGGHLQLGELPSEHRGPTEVKRLAGLYHIMQRLHSFLNGRQGKALMKAAVRMAVNDQLVQIVEAEALQTGVHALHHMFSRQSPLIDVRTHGA